MNLIRPVMMEILIERPARQKSITEWRMVLTQQGDALEKRFAKIAESEPHHSLITHMIGIERWGQQRLRVALGETLRDEEYNSYRPPQSTPWTELPMLWRQTRQDTLALIQRIPEANYTQKIRHNQFGDMTARGWVKYLHMHADLESKKLR